MRVLRKNKIISNVQNNGKSKISYSTRNSSTSKMRVEFGGMTPGCPLDP